MSRPIQPNCPFYGRAGFAFPILVPTGANQCALIIGCHAPCRMENMGQMPDWRTCSIATDAARPLVSIAGEEKP